MVVARCGIMAIVNPINNNKKKKREPINNKKPPRTTSDNQIYFPSR